MHKTRVSITFAGCFLLAAVLVSAQARKPGLWEVTATQTWQQSPFPQALSGAVGGGASALGGGRHTTLVCLTQQQIDKYGAVPQSRGCQMTNIVKKSDGMTADMVCTGPMSGKGTLEAHAIDDEHSKAKVHFVGSLQAGPNTMPVEWTLESSSVFKSADCGNVKPAPDK
jgi:hypothetical protein